MTHETLVIIPCLNEEKGLPKVLEALWGAGEDLRVVVVDNGSADASAERAREGGAEVVTESRRGYGAACRRGIAEIRGESYVVFVDADFSDHAEEISLLLEPLRAEEADFVVGSRMIMAESRSALLPQARFGNRVASFLLRTLYGQVVTDLGPFRAIRTDTLRQLGMCDRGYGWTVEMQAKAALLGIRTREVAVHYRPRVGKSKISGTLRGTLGASAKILWILFVTWFSRSRVRRGLTRDRGHQA